MFHQTSIPYGSWVLVTGATGNVATQVAKQFLERGYKVRGTVRDLSKASWLKTDIFKTYADRGDFELVAVRDLAADNAFDEAVKGMAAIAHVASVVTFSPEPEEVIPQTIKGATGILEAALKEPSVREFVFTSSVVAATFLAPGNTTHVDDKTFNETAIQLAWSRSAPEALRGSIVYAASKAEAEKAVWKFVEERRPHFTVNSVAPSYINGEQLHSSHLKSEGAWLKKLYDGDVFELQKYPTLYSVDIKDVGLLHVAAVVDPEVQNRRLQAWGDGCNWNVILAIMRQLRPEHHFIEDLPGLSLPTLSSDFTTQLGLLKKWSGQDGWRTLQQTVEDNIKSIVALEGKS